METKKPRRAIGNITARKNTKSSWQIQIDQGRDSITGKRLRSYENLKGTRREAERRLSALLRKLESGDHIEPSKINFKDFSERWLRDHAWTNLSPETAQAYEIMVAKHMIPVFGAYKLQKITPEILQRYYLDKLDNGRRDGKGGLSRRTVKHHHRLLHVIFASAVKWRVLPRNPADSVDPPQFQRKEMNTFDQEGLETFLDSLKDTEYYPVFYTLLFTGMRRSEALALRWQDIDLDFGRLSIERSLHHLNDRTFHFLPPKTEKSRRLVALPPSLAMLLRHHRDNQRAMRLTMGAAVSNNDLVFAHVDGKPLLPHSISQAWSRLAKRAGYPEVRLHDARHSHASLMLAQGVHPKVVSERLGHNSVSLTLDVYSHVLPGIQEAAALAFDEGFNNTIIKEHGSEGIRGKIY